MAGSVPNISDSVGLGWCPRICISNKFPGDRVLLASGDHTLRTTALHCTLSPKTHNLMCIPITRDLVEAQTEWSGVEFSVHAPEVRTTCSEVRLR